MLPLIAISSHIKGIVYINSQYLGEVEKDNWQTFLLGPSTYIRYNPICCGKEIYSSIIFKVEQRDNAIYTDCPYVIISNYSNNSYSLEVLPQKLASYSLPHCVCYEKIGTRFIASLMHHNNYYLVIEDIRNEFPDSFLELDFLNPDISMKSFNINGNQGLIVCDNLNRLYILQQTGKNFNIILNLNATSFLIEGDKITINKITTFNHTVYNTYKFDSNELFLESTRYTPSNVPSSDIVVDFLECLKYGIETICLNYLSFDLKSSLSFEELKNFIGDFDEIRKSPFDENVYCLLKKQTNNHFISKQFTFILKNGRIDDIENL